MPVNVLAQQGTGNESPASLTYQRKGHHADYGHRYPGNFRHRGFPQYQSQVNAGSFQRPYPYHLDYYRAKWGGSYAPYFGNLYGPPNYFNYGQPYYGDYSPYYGSGGYPSGGYGNGFGGSGYGSSGAPGYGGGPNWGGVPYGPGAGQYEVPDGPAMEDRAVEASQPNF